MVGGDPYCCELLLHDYAKVGCIDENGWQEIHQVGPEEGLSLTSYKCPPQCSSVGGCMVGACRNIRPLKPRQERRLFSHLGEV